MKRSLESVESKPQQLGWRPRFWGAKATKKAKLSPASEDTQADAHSISLSELPDLVLHQLVRGLEVEDALRLRATSSFWAGMVMRDHRLAALLVGELLPRLASLPIPQGDSNNDALGDTVEDEDEDEAENENEDEDNENEDEDEDNENEDEDEESLASDLAWMMEDAAEAARVAEEKKKKELAQQSSENLPQCSFPDPAPEPGSCRTDARWALLQEVRIAAEARLHELRLRSPDYWRDTALHSSALPAAGDDNINDGAGGGAGGDFPARAAGHHRRDEDDQDEDEDEDEDEYGRPRRRAPRVVDVETQLNAIEALSLATERVRVRATAKRSGGQNVALVALLKLELPTPQADDGQGKNEQQDQNAVYFCVEYGRGLNTRSGFHEAVLRVNQSSTLTGDRMTVVSILLTQGELWDAPLFVRQWFVELAAKLGVSWTPWQLASFVMRCAGVEPQGIRDFHAYLFAQDWTEDPEVHYYIRSRYDEVPELLDVTSRVRAIASPDLLSSLSSIVARWQYRMQLAQMWHLSAELDWPSSDKIARLASCVRSGRGDVTYLCSVEYSEVLAADCQLRLSIVAPSDQAGHDDEPLEIEVECRHSATLSYDDADTQMLVLTARGLNDFARHMLGTQSPTDKKALLQLTCAAPKPPVVTEEDTALLELIGRALDLRCEPDDNPRFYRGLPSGNSDDNMAISSQEQDRQEDDEDDDDLDDDDEAALAETKMWDSRQVGYFLALCCLTPANSFVFDYRAEEQFLVGYKPQYFWSQDPKKKLLAHLDILVYPGQVWAPETYCRQEEESDVLDQ